MGTNSQPIKSQRLMTQLENGTGRVAMHLSSNYCKETSIINEQRPNHSRTENGDYKQVCDYDDEYAKEK